MSKAALREKRRQERLARQKRQRIILGVILFGIVALVGYLIYDNIQKNKPPASDEPYIIDTFPPTPSANLITLDSGLQFEDLQVGTGEQAASGNTVSVHYTGWLEDGTQFDSSVERGEPFSFSLGAGGVIKGWDLGVAGMRVGGTRLLIIPAELGYGDAGAGGVIPPGATLIFEVQLLAIE